MTDADLERVLQACHDGRDVRVDQLSHACAVGGSWEATSEGASRRSARTQRGERAVNVFPAVDSPESAVRERLSATREQVDRLIAAGARWVGPAIYAP